MPIPTWGFKTTSRTSQIRYCIMFYIKGHQNNQKWMWKLPKKTVLFEKSCKSKYGQRTLNKIQSRRSFTLLVIKKLSNINSRSEIDIKIWNNSINGFWKTKKMATSTLRLKNILGLRYEHPLNCKKSQNLGALVDNFWRPSILLLWKFLIR